MRALRLQLAVFCVCLIATLGMTCGTSDWTSPHEEVGRDLFTSPQADPLALSPDGTYLYVANTTSNSISIINTVTLTKEVANLPVGIDPVSIAVRPDGDEVWISNHVSDSVSILDTDDTSPTYRQIIATIQDFNGAGATLFDEPVGIAFADNTKAYVALSSRNDIAVIDVATRTITKRVHITAQEPRDIAVRGGLLYVPAFESFNQSELSICPNSAINPPQCTLDEQHLADFVVESPNIPGEDARIVLDPDVPDRDLYVFNTSDESSYDVVSGIGTLLYGITVDSNGTAFITQTEARNAENGNFGDNLIDLDNRMFLNQVAEVACSLGSCSFNAGTDRIDLEVLPPAQPAVGDELANPYGIDISGDDTTLVVTAAHTSRVFTMDTATGNVLDILDLGTGPDFGQQIPRGVVLKSDGGGAPQTAYVLNTLENRVSVVDVSNPSSLVHVQKFKVGQDPTPDAIRRGRIAFNNAFASTSGTFSCASCHPDGNTDQLLWRIGGACFFGACTGDDEIRSTMPVRGLKNTLPLHWDGTLGDPFGGTNGALGGGGNEPASCSLGGPDGDHDCFLDLVDGSLSGVMCDQTGACPPGGNELSAQEKDDMAVFLASVAYPPGQARAIDDVVSANGLDGFSQFWVDQPGSFPGDLGDVVGVTTCGDMNSGCHALPWGTDTNSATLAGFDVPTMRGLTDRTLQFSIGISNAEEALVDAITGGVVNLQGFNVTLPPSEVPWNPVVGFEEKTTFAAAFGIFTPVYNATVTNIFKMVQHMSTGTSGAVGRQVTLNGAGSDYALLDDLEAADSKDVINLRGDGVHNGTPVTVSYIGATLYQVGGSVLTRGQLETDVNAGDLIATVTAHLPINHGSDPAPALSVDTTDDGTTGNPDLPVLPGDNPMTLAGIDILDSGQIIVDGQVVAGSLSCVGGSFTPICDSGTVEITLNATPSPNGLHLLQWQNPKGAISNELPICVGTLVNCQ
jgi:YVTN family beta-propeller protein